MSVCVFIKSMITFHIYNMNSVNVFSLWNIIRIQPFVLLLSRIPIRPKCILPLIAALCLPLTLQGQDNATKPSSIVGQVFMRSKNVLGPPNAENIVFVDLPRTEAEVVLIADGDTLRTETDSFGEFSFSDIVSKQVTLSVISKLGVKTVLFNGALNLKPGENIVMVTSTNDPKTPIVSIEGDKWIYRVVESFRRVAGPKENFAVEMLTKMPGVKYNKRRGLIDIPKEAIYRSYVNGAYIFALDPAAQ